MHILLSLLLVIPPLLLLPSGQLLQVDNNIVDQTIDLIFSVDPSQISGKVYHSLNFTVSLLDSEELKTPIKIFWETSGPYIWPDPEARSIILNSDNDFNASISVISSIIGIYSIQFFYINKGNDKIYFNNASEVTILVERESEAIKTYFTFTFMGLLFIAMFFMGMDIDISVIKNTLKRPIGPVVGIICQFVLMPGIAYGLGYIFLDSSYERLGFLLIGCSPGGSSSNLWTSMFHGDIDLSVTMTFISTLSSFAMMTFWVYFLGTPLVDKHIQIPYGNLALTLVSFIIPILLGVFFKRKLPQKAEIVKKRVSKPYFLIILIIIPTMLSFVNAYFFYLCTWKHIICGTLLGILGYAFGTGLAAICCQERPQIIAISLETAIQNAGICYIALNLTVKSPYSDMAVIPMMAFIFLTTGPMVFIIYGVYLVCNKIKGRREGWKVVQREEQPLDMQGVIGS